MATYYWVGGGGNWTSATYWSLTSGGTGGAGVPTSSDDVIFDTNSGTGTINTGGVCRNLTVTATQSLMFSSSSLSVYGSISLPTGGSFTWYTVPLNLVSTTTGNTLNFGDKVVQQNITFNGAGGEWTLTSNMTNGGTAFYSGTFNAGSNTLTLGGVTLGNGSAFTLNMQSATFNLGGANPWNFTNTTNFTINAGTSTIVITQNAGSFNGSGYTYYNLSRTNTQGGMTINGANTFNNITISALANTTLTTLFSANQTINGTLSVSGGSSSARIQFGSSVAGTQRTLSVATIGTLTNTNWKDIALTGAASPWTAPLGVWDLGNNSGITFDTTTLYWVGGSGEWRDGTKWSTSSGGSAANALPGPTNSVVFDSNSGSPLNIGTVGTWYCNNITGTPNAQFGYSASYGTLNVYGNLDYAAGFGGYYTSLVFLASSAKTIALRSSSMSLVFNNVNGSWTFTSNTGDFGFSGSGFSLLAGTLDTNGYSINNANISTSGTLARTLRFGSSRINFSSFNINSTTNLTFQPGTSTLVGTYHSSSFNGNGLTFNNVEFSSGYFTSVTGSNTFANLKVNATIAFINENQTVTNTLTLLGSNAAYRSRLMSATDGTQYTVTAAATSITNADFYGIVGAGTATWTGTSVGDMSLNSNITFSAPKTVYWSLAAGGDWLSSTAWANTSGGAPAVANFPLPQDTAVFDNAGLNTSATVTFPGSQYGVMSKIDCSTRTNAMTLSFNYTQYKWWFCGDITLGSGVTVSTSTYYPVAYFLGSTTLTSAGKTWTSPITITTGASLTVNNALTSTSTLINNGTLTLGANATFTTLTLNTGSVTNLNSYDLNGTTVGFGAGSTTNFGTGAMYLSGSGNVVGSGNAPTCTGSKKVYLTYAGATGCLINSPYFSESSALNFYITAGTYGLSHQNTSVFGSLDFTGFSGTWSNTGANEIIYGDLKLSSTMTVAASSQTLNFGGTSGTKTITTNGKTLGFPINFNGPGSTWQLADNFTMGSTLTHTNGSFDANGFNVTLDIYFSNVGATATRNLIMGSGVWTVLGTGWNMGTATTVYPGTSELVFANTTSAVSMSGIGKTYNKVTVGGGTNATTFSIGSSNTFAELADTRTVAHTISFFSGGTTNIGKWSVNGTAGNLVTLAPSSTTNYTLNYTGADTVTTNFLSVSRATGSPDLTWLALNSVNGGNNVKFYFDAFPSGNGLFFGSNF